MKPRRGLQQGTGGGATPAPSHPPTTAPDEEGITVDCLRQKGGEKRARSKQRMYSPSEGRMRTPHRRPLTTSQTTRQNRLVVGWKVL